MPRQSAPLNIQPWQPTPEEERDFLDGDKTREWLYSLSADDLRPFEGKWIAARDCRVVVEASSEQEVLRQVSDDEIQKTIVVHVPRPTSQRVVHIY